MKKILVILGHPKTDSLCWAIADSYISGAQKTWAEVIKLDLIKHQFNPNLIVWENDNNIFDDVNFFQHYVNDAQHIVFVYPTWWYNMPSILKWFFDRVFLPWFAYKFHKWKMLPEKLLLWRSAHIITTWDWPGFYYSIFWNPWVSALRRSLEFCWISVKKTTWIYWVRNLSWEQKKQKLDMIFELWLRNK